MPITPQTPPVLVPVAERIEQNILDTLATITIANGYGVDAIPQTPNPGIGDSLTDGRMILVQEQAEKQDDSPQTCTQWVMNYLICCEVVESEKSEISIETRRNRIRADVEFALTFDPFSSAGRPNQTRGGLAEDTTVLSPIIPAVPYNAHDGQMIVRIAVQFRTKYNDPFTSIYDA